MNKFQVTTILFCLIVLSCSKFIRILNAQNYIPTILPKDTTQLWIASGAVDNDTVLIVGEGGPKYTLDFEASGRVYWEYLPNNQNYYYVAVHQSTTYNKTIFDAADFTQQDARTEIDNTAEMLSRTIKYFKDRNKYVVVFGHSYSAWIIPLYLTNSPSLADKYIITGGRLDADSLQTAYKARGVNTSFQKDGRTLRIPDENEKRNPNRTERYWQIRENKEKLKYELAKYKFTQELAELNLSNLIYYYGQYDENVGALSEEEIAFLKGKQATVVGVETGHYRIWQRVVDAIRDGTIKL